MTQGDLLPASVEFMDRLSVETAYAYLGESLPLPGDRRDAADRGGRQRTAEQVEEEADAIGELCLAAGALEVYVGNTPSTERRMWRPRQNLAEAFKVTSARCRASRTSSCRWRRFRSLMPELERLSAPVRRAHPLLRPRRRRQSARHPGQGAGDAAGRMVGASCRRCSPSCIAVVARLGGTHQRRARHRRQARRVPAAGDGAGGDRAATADQAGVRPARDPQSR